jgi:hypothetical protein
MFALKEWENNLSPMIGKPVKILDIGIYKGIIMEEFAKIFLKSNKDAKYYGIDMWKPSEENPAINFDIIEKEANKKRSESNFQSQITFIKKEYNKALSNFSLESNSFDIIYLNTNYLTDNLYIIIMAFNLLKFNGIMIIDDYLFNKSNTVTNKIIIDTLLDANKDHINILYIGYQVIIEKVLKKDMTLTKTESNIIDYLTNKLNDYWLATDIKEYSLFFKFKDKIPEVNPQYIDFNEMKIRHINSDIFNKMKNINFLFKYKSIKYIDDEIKDKSIYLKLNKLNLLVDFSDYSLLYLINDIKIGLNHKNNSNIYIVLYGENTDNNETIQRYQTRYNLFFNFKGNIQTLSLLKYYDGEETLDQAISRIKSNNVMVEYIDARNVVGKKSLNKTNLEKMYNIILVQILLLKHVLNIDGSFKILIEENFIYVNDLLLLLNIIFEKVYIYTYSSKIGKLSLRIISKGFLGISDDLYRKIYEAVLNAKDKEIISLFNMPNTYINYEAIENNIFQATKNIIKIFDKNFDIIEKNIKEVNKPIARRTLDDVYTYLINKIN